MRLLLLFLGLFLFSCSSGIKRGKAPDDLLSKDKMVEIITDLSKHEAYIQNRYQRVDRYTKVMSNTGDSILKVYGVDRNRFESSLDYYATGGAIGAYFQRTRYNDDYTIRTFVGDREYIAEFDVNFGVKGVKHLDKISLTADLSFTYLNNWYFDPELNTWNFSPSLQLKYRLD